MNCKDVIERLSVFFDAELPESEASAVRQHLEHCEECSRERSAFADLSSIVQSLDDPPLPSDGWQALQTQLNQADSVRPADERSLAKRGRFSRVLRQFRHAGVAAAALALVFLVWLGTDEWSGPSGRELIAADFSHYVEHLQTDPEVAQRELMTGFNGRRIEAADAVQSVNYQPAAARTLPPEYTLESVYALKMPCCDCLQTVCQRNDGSRIAVFEYAEEQPTTYGDGRQTTMQCRQKTCCLVNLSENLAVTWNNGGRQITVVGVRDHAEIESLVAWLE